MKRYKFLLVIIIILAQSTSCKKGFLDVPDKTSILKQAYVTDLRTAGDYLNGIYVELGLKLYTGYAIIYPEVIADNIKTITGGSNLLIHYKWEQKADEDNATTLNNVSANMNGFWFAAYRVIRDCSYLIEEIDKYRAENPLKADDIKGQAYGVRALVHFSLVNMFAQSYSFSGDGSNEGVPYITTSDWSKPVSRQSVAEVYNGIIDDLNNAIPILNPSSTSVVLFNRNAAKALLARAYLFKGDYQSARNAAKEVTNNVPLMTGANYPSKLFTSAESEALFQLPPAYTGVAASAGSYNAFGPGVYFAAPLYLFIATSDINSILKENPNDVRKAWVTPASSSPGANLNITKYPTSLTGYPTTTFHYTTMLRSSEMYLTLAESFAKLNAEDSARFYLDVIRKRANSSAPASVATGAALLDSIYKERRKELAFEGLRMFDLLRWKKGVTRIDPVVSTAQTLPYPSNKAIAPIPLQDVNLSGLKQNEGY